MTIKVKNIYIVLFLIFVLFSAIGIYAHRRYVINNRYKNDNSDLSAYDYSVRWIYNNYPDLFNFSEDGECIITISELLKGQDEYDFDIMHDEYGNDCVGYYIVNKVDNNRIKIDSSHICEMIDY